MKFNSCTCEITKNLQDKICKLEKELSMIKNKNDLVDDEIFLLSLKEYKKYKSLIPNIKYEWWLRTPGNESYFATGVDYNSSTYSADHRIDLFHAVRPALKIDKSENMRIGEYLFKYAFLWIVIDDNLAIAATPIAFMIFDKNSNDYKSSEVRHFLQEWIK